MPGRIAIARACTAAGIPAFSPHNLRHRRISLLLREEDPVTVSRLVGHARASMSLDVYGHVLVDEAEIDYEGVLSDKLGARYDRAVHTAVTPSETKTAD